MTSNKKMKAVLGRLRRKRSAEEHHQTAGDGGSHISHRQQTAAQSGSVAPDANQTNGPDATINTNMENPIIPHGAEDSSHDAAESAQPSHDRIPQDSPESSGPS